jgi:lysophospholipase L1-like esterase
MKGAMLRRGAPPVRTALAVVICCLVVLGCSSAAGSPPAAHRTFTTFLGDSITFGLYASTPPMGFVGQLERHWPKGSAGAIGVVGATAAGIRKEVSRVDPRSTLVIVEIGTNDFQRDHTSERFGRDYSALIAALRARAPRAQLLCLGPWEPSAGVNRGGETTRDMEARIARACGSEREIRLSDLFGDSTLRGPQTTPTAWGPADSFHPNDTGHSWIAYRIAHALTPPRPKR